MLLRSYSTQCTYFDLIYTKIVWRQTGGAQRSPRPSTEFKTKALGNREDRKGRRRDQERGGEGSREKEKGGKGRGNLLHST